MATANTIYASTKTAVIASVKKHGISISPNNGMRLPMILDLALSLHFPAITIIKKHTPIHIKGNGTIVPGGGIHLVLSSLSTLPAFHSFNVGMHDSSSLSGS